MIVSAVRWGPLDVAKAILLAIGILFVSVIVLALIISDEDSLTDSELLGVGTDLWLIAAQQLIFVFVAWWFSVVKYRVDIRSLGFVRSVGRLPYLQALAGWIVTLVAITIWTTLVEVLGIDWFVPNDNVDEVVDIGGNVVALIFIVGIWGPLSEEIFFRGFVLQGLIGRYGQSRALMFSAGLFALAHIDPTLYAPIFIFGIVLGWLYLNTKSIWPAIAVHAVHNLFILSLAL